MRSGAEQLMVLRATASRVGGAGAPDVSASGPSRSGDRNTSRSGRRQQALLSLDGTA